jgi:predicted TIM-barrel fold metal-dependent hydrolase
MAAIRRPAPSLSSADTALSTSDYVQAALREFVPTSQILFGTDYPFRTSAEVIGGLTAQRFPAKALRAIERDNALRLMPELQR